MASETSRVVVTVDTEFFDSAYLFSDDRPEPPDSARELGVEGVEFVADLLERHGARGTFFVLGEVAQQLPDLVSDLRERGHEIASHGHSKAHPDLRELSSEEVRWELQESKRVLESVTGEPVKGFRAPAFAIDDDVLSEVAAAGYEYDSSVVPCRKIPGFYGFPDAPRSPFRTEEWFDAAGLVEYPVSVAPLLRLPISGAWMRLLGRRYALAALRQHVARYPVSVVYVHPWEFVDVPNVDGIPHRVAWRTGEHARETLRRIVSEHAEHLSTFEALSGAGPETTATDQSRHA